MSAVLSSVALSYFFTFNIINGTTLRKKLLNIKCFFFLQLLSETFLILKGIQQDIIINVHKSSCNVPLFLSDCN